MKKWMPSIAMSQNMENYFSSRKNYPRRHTAAVLVNGQAIIIGGNQTSSGNALTTIESFELSTLSTGTAVKVDGG